MGFRSKSFAFYYEKLLLPAEVNGLGDIRRDSLRAAHGDVAEIGIGNANNARHYPVERISSYKAIDTNSDMLRSAERTIRSTWSDRLSYELAQAPADRLPYADASFDTVVATFLHCTTPDPIAAMAEMYRVLRPGGAYIFIEHTLCSDRRRVAFLQKALTPVQRTLFHGCRLDRDFPVLLGQAPFESVIGSRATLPKSPAVLRPLYLGIASKSASSN